ncbi:MAG: hypothetical protein ACRD0B_06480 [Acidimicrobiales bacterium]
MVAFDLHTFRASLGGGRDHLAWPTECFAIPYDDETRAKTLRCMADAFEQEGRGFDRRRYLLWRDWLVIGATPAVSPSSRVSESLASWSCPERSSGGERGHGGSP